MKIKAVITKTNLTDRAIRLYIENGLVTPSYSESYAGRRNIDFSEEDVEMLKNIATLRKAGFSIAEIKELQCNPESSKDILKSLIDKINERIITDTEILSCLTPMLSNDNLTLEAICLGLNNPVVDDKSVPAEDTEISLTAKIIRIVFLCVGIFSFVFSLLCCLQFFSVELRDFVRYLYPAYNLQAIPFIATPVISLAVSLYFVFAYRRKKFLTKKVLKKKAVLSVIMLILLIPAMCFTFALTFLSLLSSPESWLVSETHNTDNYMVFDVKEAETVMGEFLPEALPDTDKIKYDYFYKNYGVAHEPPRTEVFLEIPLNDTDFDKTVKYYKSFRPSDSICEPQEEDKNDWKIIYYRAEYEYAPSNYAPVFAYNETTNTVRFICEYGQVYMKGALSHSSAISGYEW